MKEIHFTDGQSGEDWLNWRKTGIGASDICVLMGSNKFKTIFSLWNEKSGYSPGDKINTAMAHGIKNEPIARDWVNESQKLNLVPLCLEDIENSSFKASLDGYDSKKKVLCEIKCPVSLKILDKVVYSQQVPKYWLDQVQWQIMICKPTRAFIAVWDHRSDTCTTIECFADPSRQEKMRKKASDFWRTVQVGIVPKATIKDYVLIEDETLAGILDEYKVQVKIIDESYRIKQKLREQIESYSDGGSFKCNGYSMKRYNPKDTYDLEAMRSDGINIEKYIKKKDSSHNYFRIFLPKKIDSLGNPL